MKTVDVERYGLRFKVVEPASVGLPHLDLHDFLDDQEPVLERWCAGLRPGDVVVDAGAKFGSYTMPALAAGALVIAYEPCDDGPAMLKANAEANGWSDRLVVRKLALWDGTEYPVALARQVFGSGDFRAASFEHVRLDDDIRAEGLPKRVDHIKLDVEGAELGVLRGAGGTLYDYRPRLVIECHEGVSKDPADEVSRYPERTEVDRHMREMLDGLGYRIDVFPWDVSRRYWVCSC